MSDYIYGIGYSEDLRKDDRDYVDIFLPTPKSLVFSDVLSSEDGASSRIGFAEGGASTRLGFQSSGASARHIESLNPFDTADSKQYSRDNNADFSIIV